MVVVTVGVNLGHRHPPGPEHDRERGPELTTHRAVQDKVYRGVDKCQDVHHLPQLVVAVSEEALAQHDAQHSQNALGELGEEEQQ